MGGEDYLEHPLSYRLFKKLLKKKFGFKLCALIKIQIFAAKCCKML